MLLIDCIFIVLAPAAVVLPLFGGYEGFLNFSFIIFAFALLHSLMRLAFRVNISWLWMVGAVVTYGIIGSSVAISWLSSVFAALTQISLPIMIVIEGLLTVLCIQGIGQYLMFHISHFPRSSSAVKTAVLAVTLLSFLSIVAFSLPVFVDSETSATRAAAYASVLTLLILLTIANILNENAIISDAALLGAYLLLNFYLIQSATGVVIADETSSNWWQWWNGTTLKTWFQPAVAVGDWLSALRALISLSSLLVVMYRLAVFTLSYILIQSLRGNDPFSTPSDSEEMNLGTVFELGFRPLLIWMLTQSIQAHQDPKLANSVVAIAASETQWRWINIFLSLICHSVVLFTTSEADNEEWTRNWTTKSSS